MAARFLDHAAAEAAIRAAQTYAEQLRTLATALRHHAAQTSVSWRGDSYNRFCEAIEGVVRRLDQAADDSEAAAGRLAAGKQRARDDERQADSIAALP